MSKLKALKAISLLWVGSLLGALFAFLTQVVLARSLGPEDLGGFASAIAMAALFVPIVGFGVGQYWLNAFGREGWGATRWSRGSNRLIVSSALLVSLLYIAMAALSGGGVRGGTLIMIVLLHVFGQVSIELVSAKLQLEESYARLASWQLLPHVTRLLLVGLLLVSSVVEPSAIAAASVYGVVGVVLVFIAIVEIPKIGSFQLKLKGHGDPIVQEKETTSLPSVSDLMKESWPFGLASLFQLIYHQSNIIFIEKMLGAHDAGLYNVAFTIMTAVYLLPTVIYQKFLFSKIHRWATQNPAAMYEVFRKGNYAMFVVGVCFVAALWFLGDWIVPLLFGEKYRNSIPTLNVLALSAPFLFVAFSAGAPLVTKDHMKKKVMLMGGVAVFNVIANFVLISLYGLTGAALANVLSNVLLMSLYYVFAKRLVFASLV